MACHMCEGEISEETRKDNAFETFGWNVYDFSGTWASPLDRCIAEYNQQ
jgi:hypothetical protein